MHDRTVSGPTYGPAVAGARTKNRMEAGIGRDSYLAPGRPVPMKDRLTQANGPAIIRAHAKNRIEANSVLGCCLVCDRTPG